MVGYRVSDYTIELIHSLAKLTTLGPGLLSRTGHQFYGVDRWHRSDSRPLLEIMSDPGMSTRSNTPDVI